MMVGIKAGFLSFKLLRSIKMGVEGFRIVMIKEFMYLSIPLFYNLGIRDERKPTTTIRGQTRSQGISRGSGSP